MIKIDIQNLILFLNSFFEILKNWWWIILPFIFWPPFSFLWLWWREERWKKKINEIVLEIKLPEETLKPIKAMESVFATVWQFYDPPNWKEKWFWGQKLLDMSWEIASIDGVPHFYVRIPDFHRSLVESAIYAQYPDVEITEVEDYTQNIPQNIPTKEWDLWGCDMILMQDDPYPLRTYKEFEPEGERITKEEKRIDPMANLLESLGKLRPGEQIWIQITVKPITSKENDWVKKGEKILEKIMGRVPAPSLESFVPYALKGAGRVLIAGKPLEEAKLEAEKLEFGALKLSPAELEIARKTAEKIAKCGFETNIRFIYLGKKEVFFKPHLRLVLGYFNEFNTQNLNALKPWGKTITKIQLILIDRRVYLRKRRMFRNYVKRRSPLDPRSGGTFILNIEELATLYHFPSRIVAPAPTVPRIPAKKGEAPPELPTE
jgi:uncharacterized protein YggT (Ycf19 family)